MHAGRASLDRRRNMKLKYIIGWSSALCLSAIVAQAQETNEAAEFDQRLKQIQETFEKQEQAMDEKFEQKTAEQQAQIESLKKQIASAPSNPPAAGEPTNAVTPEQLKELNTRWTGWLKRKRRRSGRIQPLHRGCGRDGLLLPQQRFGCDRQRPARRVRCIPASMELNVAASVDPFAKGYAVINASADRATGEATFGVEEAALQTTSLPWNLELKAGRFFGEFGRLAYIHDHELPFVNRPLVLDQYIGGESQTDGLQVNWLPPVPHYVSLTPAWATSSAATPAEQSRHLPRRSTG